MNPIDYGKMLAKDNRGQIAEIFGIIFMGAILGVVLVNVIPVLIDNNITPQIENRDFGPTSILLWELTPLAFVAAVILLSFKVIERPRYPG